MIAIALTSVVGAFLLEPIVTLKHDYLRDKWLKVMTLAK